MDSVNATLNGEPSTGVPTDPIYMDCIRTCGILCGRIKGTANTSCLYSRVCGHIVPFKVQKSWTTLQMTTRSLPHLYTI